MQKILSYFPIKDQVKWQLVKKKFYDSTIPSGMFQIPMPCASLILENKRTEFYVCRWTDQEELKYWPLLKIGEGSEPCHIKKEVLGFDEIYFQYWIMLNEQEHYVWPIAQEAFLKQGYHLKFDDKGKFLSSTPIAPMPEDYMRPTAVTVNNRTKESGTEIFMIGGHKELYS